MLHEIVYWLAALVVPFFLAWLWCSHYDRVHDISADEQIGDYLIYVFIFAIWAIAAIIRGLYLIVRHW